MPALLARDRACPRHSIKPKVFYFKLGKKKIFSRNPLICFSIVLVLFFSYFGAGILALGFGNQGKWVYDGVFRWASGNEAGVFGFHEKGDERWQGIKGFQYYLSTYLGVLSPIVFLFSIAGIALALRKRIPEKNLFLSIIFSFFIIFSLLLNKDPRFLIPTYPFLLLFAASSLDFAVKKIHGAREQRIALISLLSMVFVFIALFNSTLVGAGDLRWAETKDIGLREASEFIVSQKPGVVVPYLKETNQFNVHSLSFYIALADSKNEFSVKPKELANEADYLVSLEELNSSEWEQIFYVNKSEPVWVYQRNVPRAP